MGSILYRSQSNTFASAELIHFEPAPITGGSVVGAAYEFVDTAVSAGQYTYWQKVLIQMA